MFQREKDYHIIFESCTEQSIKECERIQRCEAEPVEYINLEMTSSIPPVMESFWACSENKELLQLLAREFFIAKSKEVKEHIILGGLIKQSDQILDSLDL